MVFGATDAVTVVRLGAVKAAASFATRLSRARVGRPAESSLTAVFASDEASATSKVRCSCRHAAGTAD